MASRGVCVARAGPIREQHMMNLDRTIKAVPLWRAPSEVERLRLEVARLREELVAARTAAAFVQGGIRSQRSAPAPSRGAEARLALYEGMFATLPVGIIVSDGRGRRLFGNPRAQEMLGGAPEACLLGDCDARHGDGSRVRSWEHPLFRVIVSGEDRAELDVRMAADDGEGSWLRIVAEAIRDAGGDRLGAAVVLIDIDEEMRLIADKVLLLDEMNHRVKNSLQMAGSILSLQSKGASQDAKGALRSAAARIQAIAAAHAALHHHADVRSIEFGSHLRSFCASLAEGLGADARSVRIEVEAEAIAVPSEQAIPLSLIVNELVTNAVKYAFPGVPEAAAVDPAIEVRFARDAGRLVLEVSDNGAGSSAESAPCGSGLGSALVDALARQLGAEVEHDRSAGLRVRIAFAA